VFLTLPDVTHELFKYRGVNAYTLDCLSAGTVYFASPAEFNDPFDARFVERELDAEHQHFQRESATLGPDAAMLGTAAMNVFEREQRAGGVQRRIYSVSETVDSILMWSHYADSHRGICIVLEAQEENNFWWVPFAGSSARATGMAHVKPAADGGLEVVESEPSLTGHVVMLPARQVVYSDQPPGLFMTNRSLDGRQRLITFELVKHTSWEYERERRIVVRESLLADNPVRLASEAVIGVVFGIKTSKPDVLRVRVALDASPRSRPIAYWRMIDRPDGFGLDRRKFPISMRLFNLYRDPDIRSCPSRFRSTLGLATRQWDHFVGRKCRRCPHV